MPSQLKFNVFGQLMLAELWSDGWLLFVLGADGKRSRANIVIPDFVQEHEIEQYLDDIYHEMATPERPSVMRLPT